MKEEFNEQLKEVILKGIEVAEKTGEFVIEQAPELIQEFYTWAFYGNIFWIVLSLLIIISYIIFLIKVEDLMYDYEFISITWGISSFVFFIILLVMCNDLLQLLIAPKLYLIKYVLNHF